MKTILAALLVAVCVISSASADVPGTTEGTFKAAGLCGQCKTRIEKALAVEGVGEAHWSKRTHTVTVEFSAPLTLDSLQHLVAAAGHDTEKFRAPDSVYAGLPGCCRYRDTHKSH
jgi:hypothetical protein